MENADVFAACADLRRGIADWLETLAPEQLRTRSLCDGWTVQEVAGHLTRVLTLSNTALLLAALRHGGSLHRANAALGREEADRSAAELAARLRDRAEVQLTPPVVGPRGPLADLLVHSGDMRIPLGLPLDIDPEHGTVALDFLTGRAPGFVPKSRLAGLRLIATDVDRSWGAGRETRGTLGDLIMAACGRSAVMGRLSGPGAVVLAARG